jgi:hypothetical protein
VPGPRVPPTGPACLATGPRTRALADGVSCAGGSAAACGRGQRTPRGVACDVRVVSGLGCGRERRCNWLTGAAGTAAGTRGAVGVGELLEPLNGPAVELGCVTVELLVLELVGDLAGLLRDAPVRGVQLVGHAAALAALAGVQRLLQARRPDRGDEDDEGEQGPAALAPDRFGVGHQRPPVCRSARRTQSCFGASASIRRIDGWMRASGTWLARAIILSRRIVRSWRVFWSSQLLRMLVRRCVLDLADDSGKPVAVCLLSTAVRRLTAAVALMWSAWCCSETQPDDEAGDRDARRRSVRSSERGGLPCVAAWRCARRLLDGHALGYEPGSREPPPRHVDEQQQQDGVVGDEKVVGLPPLAHDQRLDSRLPLRLSCTSTTDGTKIRLRRTRESRRPVLSA